MAHWHRQSGKYVFVFSSKDGRNAKLPRALTRHLDGQPDWNVQAWVDNWERTHERPKPPKDELTDGHLLRLITGYAAYLKTRKKAPGTIQWHRQMLVDYVGPFFLNHEPPLSDINQWPGKSIKLLEYLTSRGASEATILRANTALRGFWSWLSDESLVLNGLAIRLRRPVVVKKDTPLQFTATPARILKYVQSADDDRLRLMALLGFFFSLRPFEVFALRPIDFRAGKVVEQLECCQAMARFGQFSRLAVHIHRQRVQRGTFEPPKASSKGWVACFNEQAARQLVGILSRCKKDQLLFESKPDAGFALWRKAGIPELTLKDLRRASLYWLGHKTGFELIPLKHHARHARVDTTMLYLRRPVEDVAAWQALDLDA